LDSGGIEVELKVGYTWIRLNLYKFQILDIRWEQRFSNYIKALDKLTESVIYIQDNFDKLNQSIEKSEVLSELIQDGLIHRFEYTHELAWNVMKDYAVYQGNQNITGSRDAVREAFKMQLVKDADVWMDMIASRNKTSHTYNEETAHDIFKKILEEYYPAFVAFRESMEAKQECGD
jgi:nucleotidyltransferase substrate binding protein (TIGR01987 family)